MTYQGERARPMASENGRFFEVSKVRIGADGHVSDVLWSEVDPASDRDVGAGVEASAAEVVDAIHDGAQVSAVFSSPKNPPKNHQRSRQPKRAFLIVEHEDGKECIAFDDKPAPGRNLSDMDRLDG